LGCTTQLKTCCYTRYGKLSSRHIRLCMSVCVHGAVLWAVRHS
jgi:hypothetical protein